MGKENQSRDKKDISVDTILFVLLLVFFLGMLFVYGPKAYSDSDQYIQMHIHREPMYPLFLRGIRTLFGENYLYPMGILQSILMVAAICFLTKAVAKRFRLSLPAKVIVILFQLVPHIMTKYFSVTSMFITNSVMGEALTFPFFTFWFGNSLVYLWEGKRKNSIGALVFAFLISITRGQMMITILLWMLMMFYRNVLCNKERRIRSLAVILLITVGVFGLRSFFIKSYNLYYNGHFIGNTYGNVTFLSNILYASDREDGENIADEEAREFFYTMYDMADEAKYNYKYAGNTIKERAEHLEQCHDTIKWLYIEDVFYQYYDKNVTQDYIIQNLMADEVSMVIMKGILPKCFGTWLWTYICLTLYGFIRTVAVVHPLLNLVAVALYLAAFVLTFLLWKKDHQSAAVKMMVFTLFIVAANVCSVATAIMCLSRYVIYGFVPFYTAGFMVCVELLKDSRYAKLLTESEEGKES